MPRSALKQGHDMICPNEGLSAHCGNSKGPIERRLSGSQEVGAVFGVAIASSMTVTK